MLSLLDVVFSNVVFVKYEISNEWHNAPEWKTTPVCQNIERSKPLGKLTASVEVAFIKAPIYKLQRSNHKLYAFELEEIY